ncbi:MAG: LysM domain-containing protein [Chloroflexi bacterium]|nr:LysM domain-containing protein [Chloroflexota bacterium]MCC6894134.1 LysM peptidoglycan-binding domain-containing protein [Anaerolineae bacterium]
MSLLTVNYIVNENDTWESIASYYGITVDLLKAYNQPAIDLFGSNKLRPGYILSIPIAPTGGEWTITSDAMTGQSTVTINQIDTSSIPNSNYAPSLGKSEYITGLVDDNYIITNFTTLDERIIPASLPNSIVRNPNDTVNFLLWHEYIQDNPFTSLIESDYAALQDQFVKDLIAGIAKFSGYTSLLPEGTAADSGIPSLSEVRKPTDQEIQDALLRAYEAGKISAEDLAHLAIQVTGSALDSIPSNRFIEFGPPNESLERERRYLLANDQVRHENGGLIITHPDGSEEFIEGGAIGTELLSIKELADRQEYMSLYEEAGDFMYLASDFLMGSNIDKGFADLLQTWDGLAEAALLQQLDNEILVMPPDVLGLSTTTVTQKFRAYHNAMRRIWEQKNNRYEFLIQQDRLFRDEVVTDPERSSLEMLVGWLAIPMGFAGEPWETLIDAIQALLGDPFAAAALVIPFLTGGELRLADEIVDGVDTANGLRRYWEFADEFSDGSRIMLRWGDEGLIVVKKPVGGISAKITVDWSRANYNIFDPNDIANIEQLRLKFLSKNDTGKVIQTIQRFGLSTDSATVNLIKKYNFDSPGISFTYENYLAWKKLTSGEATINDVLYFYHESNEVKYLQQSGFNYLGSKFVSVEDKGFRNWEQNFQYYYRIAHSEALSAEYDLLAETINKLTLGEVKISYLQVAASDPTNRGEEALQYMLVDDKYFLSEHPSLTNWKRSEQIVNISTKLGKCLGIKTDAVTLSQLIASVRAMPLSADCLSRISR